MPEINDIFISYGRAESQYFASKLNTRLMEKGLEVWFDQEDIPLGVDFQEQIYDGIEKSKNFVYIIAPHSIKSEYCTKELQHAIYLKKRIIPILHIKPLLEDEKKYLLPEISKLNWIFFREEFIANVPQKEFKPIDDFEKSFAGLLELIGKDSEYLTQHTQYLVRAMEWEKSGKKKKNLLRIEEIEPAQKWSDEENYKEKPPVFVPQILKDYIRESKKSKYLLGVQSMDAHKDMFISYSRRSSLEFVWDVFMELTDKDYEIWFDQNDIPLGVDFQEQINSGIVNADAFIYVISPTSIRSEYCLREIKLAAELGKRIIPILHVMPSDEEMKLMHPVIEKLNWVYMQQGKDDVKKALFDLRKLLSTHKEYVEQHTVILKSAIHWDKNQRATQQLLVGNERQVAEDWLRTDFSKEQPPCLPSDLMCEFIAESKKNANNLMTEVFIAYDVDDLLMRDEVNKYLIRHGFTTWVHQSDIKAGVDYGKAIELGIEQADNLLFLISPRSVKSKYCMVELNYALSLNKRVIPIQIEPTEIETFPPELKQIQFIDFTEKGGKREDGKFFDVKNLQRLVKEINKDKRYFEEHKAFQNQALKWIRQNRNSSILLRGYNLDKAKTWLKEGQKSSYPPTQLHEEFINESIANIGQLNTEVFISYSRTDGDFARKLNEQFQLSGKTTWFDQESIASGADFQKEIYKGIEQADNFVFVISPEAVRSQYCADEVEYAGNLNKRFVTILYRPTDPAEIHPLLASVQWIDFSNKEFPTSYNELLRTIDIDRDYVQSHTKWSQLGVKWIENNRDAALLLRGVCACRFVVEKCRRKKQESASNLHSTRIYFRKSCGNCCSRKA